MLLALCVGIAGAFQQPRVASSPLTSTFPSQSRPSFETSHLAIHNPPLRTLSLTRLAGTNGNDAAPAPKIKKLKPVVATAALIGLDIFFRRFLQAQAISFPSSLAGCGALFATFLLVPKGGSMLYNFLAPGAALLAKWLPVFFVPSLVTLPLADSVGSAAEVSAFQPDVS